MARLSSEERVAARPKARCNRLCAECRRATTCPYTRICPQCYLAWRACACQTWPPYLFFFNMAQVWQFLLGGAVFKVDVSAEPVRRSGSAAAPFESVSCIEAEIAWRLARVRRDPREALEDEIMKGAEKVDQLSRPAFRALRYVSGWAWKRQSYAEWDRDMTRREEKQRSVQKPQNGG